jgi:diguanylate cyclase (GGDEF)-like protein/PAS domain S-box-containing protein
MFGVPQGSPLASDTFAHCIHPDDREYVFSHWALALKGEPYDLEHRIVVDGKVRWVREVAEVTFAADGTPLEGLGTVLDITELKRTQDMLRYSEAFNVSVFDSIIESVAVLNEKGIILAVNAPWHGFAKENGAQNLIGRFVGQDYLRICADAARPPCSVDEATVATSVAEGICAVLEGVQTRFEMEYPCHSPQAQRWFSVRVSPLYGSRPGAVVAHLDITARKLAEIQHRLSEERYRKQFSDNSAVMLMLDPVDGRIIDANVAAVAFYGYSHSQLMAMRITDINPISVQAAKANMESVQPAQGSHFEFQHRLADGSLRDVEAFSSQIMLEDRNILHVIVHDISERKRAQEALGESEQRYRLLFDMSADAIMLTSPDGRIFDANPAACHMFQRSQAEICQLGRNAVVDISDPQLARAIEVRRITGSFAGENVFMRKDASKFIGEVSTALFTDKDGNARTSMIIRDISERKRIETALLDSERRMSAVFQASPIGILISKVADGAILDLNDATLQQFGYARDEVIGKRTTADLAAYVKPAQRDELVHQLREYGRVHQFPIEYSTRRGEQIVMEVSAQILELQSQTCMLAMMVDVTARHSAEALIHEQALHDSLTQLPNRRLLANRLRQAMVAAKRSGYYCALTYIDLDNFKPLNDLHGHDVGDLLLIEVSVRLKSCVREMDTVSRVGGDEFVVMISELDQDLGESTRQAAAVAEKVGSLGKSVGSS